LEENELGPGTHISMVIQDAGEEQEESLFKVCVDDACHDDVERAISRQLCGSGHVGISLHATHEAAVCAYR